MTDILYLHGFRSSPASYKARMLGQALADLGLADRWHCPQLPADPARAAALILEQAQAILSVRARATNESPPSDPASALTVIGSSLGGYYATWLAERTGCRAIMLNPAVHAARDLATQVGSHTQFHTDEPFEFLPDYVDALRALWVEPLTRMDRYVLIAATGDEVLDWREMRARFEGARQHIVQGGDHGLSDFAPLLPIVLQAAGIDAPPPAA